MNEKKKRKGGGGKEVNELMTNLIPFFLFIVISFFSFIVFLGADDFIIKIVKMTQMKMLEEFFKEKHKVVVSDMMVLLETFLLTLDYPSLMAVVEHIHRHHHDLIKKKTLNIIINELCN